ncbi:MAG: Fis family transcriptional regulator [Acidobacteriia bacterium]|nr:Fis family transcriptional regulator [Terriglobia bacterium]
MAGKSGISFADFAARVFCRGWLRACWLVMLTAGIAGAQSQVSGNDPRTGPVSTLAREMLAAHNAVRGQVKVPPLQWSDQLAAVAQKWADKLLAEHRFVHSPDSRYGENLFDITGAAAKPSVVIKHWASEFRNYNYASNACNGICGHYTQIVWRDSKRVGCAVARGGGREVWVCNYDPPGNWVGQRPY